jgi:hypothetical protein
VLDPEAVRALAGSALRSTPRAIERVEHEAVRAIADRVDCDLPSARERRACRTFEHRGIEEGEPDVAGFVRARREQRGAAAAFDARDASSDD